MFDIGMHGFGVFVGWLLPFIVIVFAFYLFINRDSEPSARDVLDMRYANGEIDDAEYKTKREALEK
jgi:putative membrane protein